METYVLVIVLVVVLAQFAQPVAARTSRMVPRGSLLEEDPLPRRKAVNRLFALLAAAVLIGFAALRYRIGVDYVTYQQSYSQYLQMPNSDLGPFDEPGIKLIAKAAARIYNDPIAMFAIASVITVGLTVYTIYKNTTALPLALLLYILAESWQGSFNGVRQYLACAVLFAGHKYILERRFRPWLLVVFAAMLFHISALIMLLAYWIPKRQLRPSAIVLMLVLAATAVNFYGYFGDAVSLIRVDDVSAGSYFVETVNPLRILAAFGPSILYLLFTVKATLSERGHFYANLMFINAVILLSAAGSAYVARFNIYTGVFLALAIPEMINARDRKFRTVLVLTVVSLYAVFWYLDTSPISALNPYRSVFGR